jgi:tyrosine decarboxylase/aspartate 1-decarboxylase
MCTKTHPIAQKAHQLYINSNLGDPGLFPGSVQLEKEVINQLATLLHGKNCVGSIVSGGTEANLLAMLAARNKTGVNQPEAILPESVHFSFTKICNLLNVKPVYTDLDSSFKAVLSSVEKCVNKNTIAIVGTAGTAELGTIDPFEGLSKIALDHNVWLHVDAAFGGLVIPFLKGSKSQFDFSLEGVKSITVDPHKMGMAAIPAGGIIFKDAEALDFIKTETPYLTDQYQYTFAGTRTGASAASAWAVFQNLGINGFEKIVSKCMKTTQLLSDELKNAGFSLVIEPTLNIAAFRSPSSTRQLAEKLWQQGWFVSYVPRYDCIRVVVMPHVKKKHVLAFLKDLTENQNL